MCLKPKERRFFGGQVFRALRRAARGAAPGPRPLFCKKAGQKTFIPLAHQGEGLGQDVQRELQLRIWALNLVLRCVCAVGGQALVCEYVVRGGFVFLRALRFCQALERLVRVR